MLRAIFKIHFHFFLKKGLCIWKTVIGERRLREYSICLFIYKIAAGARLRSQIRSPSTSPMCVYWPSLLLSMHISRRQDWMWRNFGLGTSTHMGCQHWRQRLNMTNHNASKDSWKLASLVGVKGQHSGDPMSAGLVTSPRNQGRARSLHWTW